MGLRDIEFRVPPDLTAEEEEWIHGRLVDAIAQISEALISRREQRLIDGDTPGESFVGMNAAFGIGKRLKR